MNGSCIISPSGKKQGTEYIDSLFCDCKLLEMERLLDELYEYLAKNEHATISKSNRDKLTEIVDRTYAARTLLKQRLYS